MLLILSIIGLALAALFAAMCVVNLSVLRPPEGAGGDAVSILIPARDEAGNIGAALDAALGQRGVAVTTAGSLSGRWHVRAQAHCLPLFCDDVTVSLFRALAPSPTLSRTISPTISPTISRDPTRCGCCSPTGAASRA